MIMKKIAIIGLGYVGLPLARLFATKYSVVGFDINQKRVNELKGGTDNTLEVEEEILKKVLKDSNSEAAGTKWNFLKYSPGLVGGHCISVDPYYLATKAESLGYTPQVILSGRHVNNSIAPLSPIR